VVATIVAFAVREMINGSFSTIDYKQSSRISVSGTERIYSFVSLFHNYLSTVV